MKKLLYVDDAQSLRRLVELVLGQHYKVTLAENGLEGLKALEKTHFDVIITDVNMPHMDGFELLEAIRKHPSQAFTPVLMLTTEADEEMKQRGKLLGATGWIVKPFHPEKLAKVVDKLTL